MTSLEHLADRARDGDTRALEELLVRSSPDLRRFAMRVCNTGEDAEDAVQHALFVMWTRIGAFRKAARFTTWIFTVIRNECTRHFRTMTRWARLDDDDFQAEDNPEETVERAELLDVLVGAIRTLQPALRQVFVLRELEGCSTIETSERLGISEENVKVRLHRARLHLRESVANKV